ncbi:GAF domain-containing protein [Streptomyces sp. NPDC048623]|uniref:GAF domain-containing protein n=1 Tax=Streptomyces sp. NPDC048623 TaxID=3155761 RepID=UPI003421B0DF
MANYVSRATGATRLKVGLLNQWTGLAISVLLVFAGPGIALTHGAVKVAIFFIVLVVALLNGARVALTSQEAGGYQDAAGKAYLRIYGAGSLSLNALSNLCKAIDAGPDSRELERLRHAICESAREALGGYDTESRKNRRAVIYELTDTGQLHRTEWTGREGRAPRNVFSPDTVSDRDVLHWVRNAPHTVPDPDIIGDVHGTPSPRGSVSNQALYRSFASVPIYTEDKAYGMLAVDSTDKKAFSVPDGQVLRMLATMLAAALAHVEGKPRSEGAD